MSRADDLPDAPERIIPHSLPRPTLCCNVLLVIYGLALLNTMGSGFRFTSPCLNILTLLTVLHIPLACLYLLYFAPRHISRPKWAVKLLLPVGILSWGVAAWVTWCQGETIENNRYASVQCLEAVPVAGVPVRVYEEKGFWNSCIFIQQERTICPGLLWIHPLHTEDSACGVDIKVLDTHRFRCNFWIESWMFDNPPTKHTVFLTAH